MSLHCRVCDAALSATPSLSYCGMPKSAQYFPDEFNVGNDSGVDLHVYECGACGLIQLSAEPVSYYREVIRAASVSSEMAAFRRAQFTDWVEKYQLHQKKVLEVGCGRGEYLEILAQTGVDAYGVEYGELASEHCQSQGLNVETLFLEDRLTRVAAYPFDAFVMLNFLEHLPSPVHSLQAIADNLKSDAIGLVEVPNFEMIIEQELFSEFIPDHLSYFTKETLITTLNLAGFEVLSCQAVWHEYNLSAVVRKRASKNLKRFELFQHDLKRQLDHYINTFPSNSVAIWGAGHQALAIMALADLSGKIRFVVDSATFKQNKLTPATHIPITAPAKLEQEPISAIIIMAGSFSDEIYTILKTMRLNNPGIAVVDGAKLKILE
ncbi:MAG TPA: methyltransferase domain-containing protein [Methylophaga aminisulfidivorans]|uniref:class I SAM-dependent methyltransferase n=1 Tax=Methylophaga TaxID=40222 RepID=UPI00175E3CC0|nr:MULTISPECIES: class I SAM-dependent methyltransferase [Methylophaga]HIC47370.1 methyltransferase domain-containing protein [Methylophaga sp.]HIM38718.1 methyltransferase domain-containing protein [Methylophaga aminisulfidivorans]